MGGQGCDDPPDNEMASHAGEHATPPPVSGGGSDVKRKIETLKKVPNNILARMYSRLHKYYKGDPGKLTLFTMVVLVASELPIYFFTLLDLLKLPGLWKYRLHYDQTETRHLGVRNYPPVDLVWKTAKGAEFNFLCA